MRIKYIHIFLFALFVTNAQAQVNWLSKTQIVEDLDFLRNSLDEKSSYVYLNGYDFNFDFDNYINTIGDSTRLEDFGMFITNTLAKIGDRHASLNGIRGYALNESLFLPFIYAPVNDKVLVLNRTPDKELALLNAKFPYLKKIDEMDIGEFLQKTRPEDIAAPKETYFTYAVRDIRDIEKNYLLLDKSLPQEIKITLSDFHFKHDTTYTIRLVNKSQRQRPWDEKFEIDYLFIKEEDYNKAEIIDKLFSKEDNLAYVKIPEMTDIEEAPLLFDKVNAFMKSIQNDSKALIIDVRANSGGTRDLLYEFAKYLIHPDSIYVVNATKQRGSLPLSKDFKESLHQRFLFSFSELDKRGQEKVKEFLKTFDPIYELDQSKYSEYYFGLLK